ncbi:hypothetical protein BDQ17DRAFT_1333362 [Cyathus striatus]|nr:hypothetical protein BDQ17DRAFT_1333362 [Cyathus striatus]
MSIPIVLPVTIPTKYGPMLVATFVNASAYGIALVRNTAWHYNGGAVFQTPLGWNSRPSYVFDYLILKFGRSELFNTMSNPTLYFTAFVAQMFYASRIWSSNQIISNQIHAAEAANTYTPSNDVSDNANGGGFKGHAGTFSNLKKNNKLCIVFTSRHNRVTNKLYNISYALLLAYSRTCYLGSQRPHCKRKFKGR